MKVLFILFAFLPSILGAEMLSHKEVIKMCKNACVEKENGVCTHRGYRDCDFISSIARKESSYNTEAFNPEVTGSYGLMQIQCSTARNVGLKYGCEQLFNPIINIRFAIRYILSLEKKLKGYTTDDLFAAYNAGLKTKKGKDGASYTVKRCKRYRRFSWHGMPTVICYKGEYINQEYVWHSRRYYDLLKREKSGL